MSNPTNTRTIPQLPTGATLTGSELLEISQNGTSANTTSQDIANLNPPFNINSLPNAPTLNGLELSPVFRGGFTFDEPGYGFAPAGSSTVVTMSVSASDNYIHFGITNSTLSGLTIRGTLVYSSNYTAQITQDIQYT